MLTWGHALAIVAIVAGVLTALVMWMWLTTADPEDDEATGWE